jgi:hypothetical protein
MLKEKRINLSAMQRDDGRIRITDKRAGEPWLISDYTIAREYDRLLGATGSPTKKAMEFAKALKFSTPTRMADLNSFAMKYIVPAIIAELK